MGRLVVMIVCALLTPGLAAAQSAESETPWGDPNLQGMWTNTTTTPLQRPSKFAGRAVLTDEELAELAAQANRNVDRPPPPGSTGAYNSFWLDRGTPSAQTSLIVDPLDGRLPAVTERVRERDAALNAARNGAPDSIEALNLYDRCITRGLPGAMIPGFYNHNYQILQTPDYVVILVEMIHDARIIPLDGRPRLPPGVGQWLGDSRARWDGETLVIETTHFSPKADERAMSSIVYALSGSKNLHLVERFKRVDVDTIDYQFTVTDPATYTQPWTASIPMRRIEGPLFEYACHEGNRGPQNILRGARVAEGSAGASGR